MSTSTVTIIKPEKRLQHQERRTANLGSVCLWMLAGIISTSKREITDKGVAVTLRFRDTLSMFLSTFFLIRGLSLHNLYYVLPWIGISIWNQHFYSFPNLMKAALEMQRVENVSKLAWIAFGFNLLSEAIRTALILTVIQLSTSICLHKLKKKV